MAVTYLHSAYYRNGEDIVFYEPEFHELAYQIAMNKHTYEFSISNLGWHLHFRTPAYELEIVEESWWKGYAKLIVKA